MRERVFRRRTGTGLAVLATAGAILATGTPATAAGGSRLSGLLKLTAGKARTTAGKITVSGTYFRMIEPGGAGYFQNTSSTAGHSAAAQTYTLLSPGKDGGLKLGSYEPAPAGAAAFKNGNSVADLITEPQKFESIYFSISTNKTDTQTHSHDTAPSLTLNGDKITGNLGAWNAQWNNQSFNQGSPKPSGDAYAGGTRPVTGTYNAKTHAFTITWYSYIVGGPFNGFTGYWHLQGTLEK